MIMSTQPLPVNGRLHFDKILFPPSLALCSMVTITFVPGAATKSMAPPIPFTSFPCAKHMRNYQIGKCLRWNSQTNTNGDHPIGQIAVLWHFHRTEHGHIDVSASDHGKALVGSKVRCTGYYRNGLFASIYQFGIDLMENGEIINTESLCMHWCSSPDLSRGTVPSRVFHFPIGA